MAIRDGEMKPQDDSDLVELRLERITNYMDNTQVRGARAEEMFLNNWLEELQKQDKQTK